MLFEWFSKKIPKVGFEDVIHAQKHQESHIIINTLPQGEQDCLILHTLPMDQEEETINQLLENYDISAKRILVYGKHACDETAEKKCRQLQSLGFTEVYLYAGGLFEWILLQDVYTDEFPTLGKVGKDLLRFRPKKFASIPRLR
jgi:rhodanese-related sulfurtransferase